MVGGESALIKISYNRIYAQFGIVHETQTDNTGGTLAAITPPYYILDLLE